MNEKKGRPQDKWDAKAGVIPKTYKIKKDVADQYQEACRIAGVAMGTQLTEMMQEFISRVNSNNEHIR